MLNDDPEHILSHEDRMSLCGEKKPLAPNPRRNRMSKFVLNNNLTPAMRTDVALKILGASSLASLVEIFDRQPHEIAHIAFNADLLYADQMQQLRELALHHVTQQLRLVTTNSTVKEYGDSEIIAANHCTVGDLKKIISNLPNNMPVQVPRHDGPGYYQVLCCAVTKSKGKDGIKTLNIGD